MPTRTSVGAAASACAGFAASSSPTTSATTENLTSADTAVSFPGNSPVSRCVEPVPQETRQDKRRTGVLPVPSTSRRHWPDAGRTVRVDQGHGRVKSPPEIREAIGGRHVCPDRREKRRCGVPGQRLSWPAAQPKRRRKHARKLRTSSTVSPYAPSGTMPGRSRRLAALH